MNPLGYAQSLPPHGPTAASPLAATTETSSGNRTPPHWPYILHVGRAAPTSSVSRWGESSASPGGGSTPEVRESGPTRERRAMQGGQAGGCSQRGHFGCRRQTAQGPGRGWHQRTRAAVHAGSFGAEGWSPSTRASTKLPTRRPHQAKAVDFAIRGNARHPTRRQHQAREAQRATRDNARRPTRGPHQARATHRAVRDNARCPTKGPHPARAALCAITSTATLPTRRQLEPPARHRATHKAAEGPRGEGPSERRAGGISEASPEQSPAAAPRPSSRWSPLVRYQDSLRMTATPQRRRLRQAVMRRGWEFVPWPGTTRGRL